jgi:hypothetical protein
MMDLNACPPERLPRAPVAVFRPSPPRMRCCTCAGQPDSRPGGSVAVLGRELQRVVQEGGGEAAIVAGDQNVQRARARSRLACWRGGHHEDTQQRQFHAPKEILWRDAICAAAHVVTARKHQGDAYGRSSPRVGTRVSRQSPPHLPEVARAREEKATEARRTLQRSHGSYALLKQRVSNHPETLTHDRTLGMHGCVTVCAPHTTRQYFPNIRCPFRGTVCTEGA